MTPRQMDALRHLNGHPWSQPCDAAHLARYRISRTAGADTPLHPLQTGDARRTLDALAMLGLAYQVGGDRPSPRFRIRRAGRARLGYPSDEGDA